MNIDHRHRDSAKVWQIFLNDCRHHRVDLAPWVLGREQLLRNKDIPGYPGISRDIISHDIPGYGCGARALQFLASLGGFHHMSSCELGVCIDGLMKRNLCRNSYNLTEKIIENQSRYRTVGGRGLGSSPYGAGVLAGDPCNNRRDHEEDPCSEHLRASERLARYNLRSHSP